MTRHTKEGSLMRHYFLGSFEFIDTFVCDHEPIQINGKREQLISDYIYGKNIDVYIKLSWVSYGIVVNINYEDCLFYVRFDDYKSICINSFILKIIPERIWIKLATHENQRLQDAIMNKSNATEKIKRICLMNEHRRSENRPLK